LNVTSPLGKSEGSLKYKLNNIFKLIALGLEKKSWLKYRYLIEKMGYEVLANLD
jgi:hypothetical protein